MNVKQVFHAIILSLVVTFNFAAIAKAQSIQISGDGRQEKITVFVDSSVVLNSDIPFAELSIVNPNIADIATLSDRSIYILGKLTGSTTISAFDAFGGLVATINVTVELDTADMREVLSDALPGEPIEVRTANGAIVLSGIVSSIAVVNQAFDIARQYTTEERVLNLLTVGGSQQVMLKVKFAEIQRNASKALGIGVSSDNVQLTNELLSGGDISGSGTSFGTSTGVAFAGEAALGLTTAILSGGQSVFIDLTALEDKGLLRTLAEPNLTALSGETASFNAGGEYPLPTVGENNQVGVDYRPFGVQLNFIPTVLGDGIINLQMNASVSAIDGSTTVQVISGDTSSTITAFTDRQVQTTVEMRDGQTFVIGGILQDDFTDAISQVPWIGDVPILGSLFRSTSFNRRQTELVIMVTAHLVSPTSGDALILPTDRVSLPTEADLFLGGSVAGQRPNNTLSGRNGGTGDIIFDLPSSTGYALE